MTDNDQQAEKSTGRSTRSTTDDTSTSTVRTRTRSRTRTGPPEPRGPSRDTPAADDTNTSSPTRRRSRRASRDADAPNTEASSTETAAGDETADSSERSGGGRKRRRRGGRGRGKRGRGGGSTSTPTEDTAAPADTTNGDDEAIASAIASGGTRAAARRGRTGGDRRGPRTGGVPEELRRAMLDGPPRTMLVTAREDRTQIAVLEDRAVVEHYVTRKDDITYVGNIYMARVQNVLPGMEAAFLDIGKGRNGVLYAGEVLYDELDLEEGAAHRIENALKPGQNVLVQVTKDPMGTKGPRLTMHLSLAGRYVVLAPNSDLFGISRKLTDRERDRLRKIVKQHKPDEHGVIVRTAAEGATEGQLAADMARLLAKWQRVTDAAEAAKALDTVYEEPPLVVKVIRDNFGPEFVGCVVDDEQLYQQVRSYLEEVAPELLDKVELYGQPTRQAAPDAAETTAAGDADGAETAGVPAEAAADDTTPSGDDAAPSDAPADGDGVADDADVPPAAEDAPVLAPLTASELEEAATRRAELPALFEAYDVYEQLRKAMARKVWLPSGGYLIIETTEAMKVIDVNTGRFTGDADTNLEEVVLKTNLEAAEEIVRQLRLRDMGGIIVIDFIDMLLKANQDQVVRRLKRELLRDRTKTRVSEVSRLGLVQMTRKNVSQGLIESFSHTCETCEGRGIISELE
ncbi:MAG: ribonuclease E/G [Nitriliruptoraceae bacterium]